MAEFGNPQVKVGSPKFAGLPASQSVIEIFKKLEDSGPVTSWEVVKALLELHPGYGKGLGKDLLSAFPPVESKADSPFQGENRTVREWLEAVARLYDPAVELLHGRMVIIGLTMVDPNLERFIVSSKVPDFIEILKREGEGENFWGRPFAELLTRPGPAPESETPPEPKPPTPSDSVIEVFKELSPLGQITSWKIVEALLRQHPEYGGGRGEKQLSFPPTGSSDFPPFQGETRTVVEWLDAVAALYDPTAVQFLGSRMVIIGLTIIDRDLEKFITSKSPDFIEILKQEGEKNWRKPFEELLIRTGPGPESETPPEKKPPPPPPEEYDPAVQHDDSPAHKDILGRDGFAYAVATWLTRLWEKNQPVKEKTEKKKKPTQGEREGNSFVMNIYGPWGSGKSSMLNLIKSNLEPKTADQGQAKPKQPSQSDKETSKSSPPGQVEVAKKGPDWIVVEFNAWQHQHLTPVWWPLLDQVYQQVVQKLAKRQRRKAWQIRLWEYRWRLFAGRKLYLIAMFACSFVFGILALLFGLGFDLKELAATVGKILTILGAIWFASLALSRSLLPGSVSSAQMFQQLTRDPLAKVKNHYHALIKKFDYPVMVFIDDLDRCQPNYVVKLLEGIQTLYNSSKVFYIIAADRRWLHKCFENEYQSLAVSVLEPGRRMGNLFLEKVFQLEVPMPRLSDSYQQVYMDYLVRGGKTELDEDLKVARAEAQKVLKGARSQEEIIDRVKIPLDISTMKARREAAPRESTQAVSEEVLRTILDQAIREEAVRQSASPEVEISTQYYLRKFAHLLEPNPRAMKRLVTAWGIYRAIAMNMDETLIDSIEKRNKFVLWVIIKLRWPLLEDCLMKDPGKIDDINSFYNQRGTIFILDAALRPLVTDEQVKRVITGDKIGVRLDKDALSNFIRLG